jgi:hypothetical protein
LKFRSIETISLESDADFYFTCRNFEILKFFEKFLKAILTEESGVNEDNSTVVGVDLR